MEILQLKVKGSNASLRQAFGIGFDASVENRDFAFIENNDVYVNVANRMPAIINHNTVETGPVGSMKARFPGFNDDLLGQLLKVFDFRKGLDAHMKEV